MALLFCCTGAAHAACDSFKETRLTAGMLRLADAPAGSNSTYTVLQLLTSSDCRHIVFIV
jgi:hypothetical protein